MNHQMAWRQKQSQLFNYLNLKAHAKLQHVAASAKGDLSPRKQRIAAQQRKWREELRVEKETHGAGTVSGGTTTLSLHSTERAVLLPSERVPIHHHVHHVHQGHSQAHISTLDSHDSSDEGIDSQGRPLPFKFCPGYMRNLKLQSFLKEVQLQQDVIELHDGRRVEEPRLTGWQSDIGATFEYSGKIMRPSGPLSPEIRKVRDQLIDLTGVKFDSVLINYYKDGRCGMRFHSDPLYGCWTSSTAVVSIGQARRFVFRETHNVQSRWEYTVKTGDVVFMFGDCQDRLQHCIKVEREDKGALEMGPRMSLVFKQRALL
ncbi:hypothetical protein CEUSTIGMA_g3200.t1 [Chlamydomonas eustigma]|uniref:Fe2OG dioxygenase domain-containing protein n=1 Tax=Chlamydomonas eustigma TaxID=1157962 RepID=A0A250WY46_9CHLO|nr:hypothetical protein CEUSTIGMA_g3200.t1 [Chlamydomonas eustigma]|eukprot:GAX75757.1 hypothetical protein CEUSTIGMA_g3200.t1 [Chlamydomonas eustigma]